MAGPNLDNLSALLDDAKCFALVRQHRWPNGVRCAACASSAVIRDGCDATQRSRQRYRCKACSRRFDDLTGTVLAGHHQPLRVWVLCLYFMGLNVSNRQIAAEMGLNASDVQVMTEQLRGGLVARPRPRGWRARWKSTRSTSWPGTRASPRRWPKGRSEEHTSELQSRQYLVCRLLLEKK